MFANQQESASAEHWCKASGTLTENIRRLRDDLLSHSKRSARKQLGAETRLGWKSSGLPTRVS
ncbi:hypothetical protein ACLD5W_03995 [Gardnerella greenwoodii]|uniref:hypothetical protein n=1 Tax=Gardnerella greenwoodii TaxID=2914925 RepID=UPI0039711243